MATLHAIEIPFLVMGTRTSPAKPPFHHSKFIYEPGLYKEVPGNFPQLQGVYNDSSPGIPSQSSLGLPGTYQDSSHSLPGQKSTMLHTSLSSQNFHSDSTESSLHTLYACLSEVSNPIHLLKSSKAQGQCIKAKPRLAMAIDNFAFNVHHRT
jgi:hypothetical protein